MTSEEMREYQKVLDNAKKDIDETLLALDELYDKEKYDFKN